MRYTYEDFIASRTPCPDLGATLGDESLIGMSGFLYADYAFIARNGEAFWTIAERDEIVGTLAECEQWLWANYGEREFGR
jgi:hypothetical protein